MSSLLVNLWNLACKHKIGDGKILVSMASHTHQIQVLYFVSKLDDLCPVHVESRCMWSHVLISHIPWLIPCIAGPVGLALSQTQFTRESDAME